MGKKTRTIIAVLAAVLALSGCNKNGSDMIDTSSALINTDHNHMDYDSKPESSTSSEPPESAPIPTRPDDRKPIIPQGIADEEQTIFPKVSPEYNTTFKPNLDDGTEITIEIIPTAYYPTSTLPTNEPYMPFEELYNYWKETTTPPVLIEFDDTSYRDIVNIIPVDFGLSICGNSAEHRELVVNSTDDHKTTDYIFDIIPHRFNASDPDKSPTVYLELVDGDGYIITDPSVLSYDSEAIRVKSIVSEATLFGGTSNQQTPLIFSFNIRTFDAEGEEQEIALQVGNRWGDVTGKIDELFDEKDYKKFFFTTTDNGIEEYAVLKTSKYTLILYSEGTGSLKRISLIRN